MALDPVHRAMDEERPEKVAMRDMWVEEVRRYTKDDAEEPWYLTLPGPAAKDIRHLQDAGIIGRTEVGGIGTEHLTLVVALESKMDAVTALKREVPGLRVIDSPVHNFLHSSSFTTWPTGEHADLARARVVNLDLNSAFSAEDDQGQLSFPLARLIYKFAELHARDPYVNWTLCLTLHADLSGDPAIVERIGAFLRDNFTREPQFREDCVDHLGTEIVDAIEESGIVVLDEMDREVRQRLLMALVPKAVAAEVIRVGWRVEVARNVRYGAEDAAPMVAWIMRFEWDPDARSEQDRVYREVLAAVLRRPLSISVSGDIVDD